MLFKSQGDLHIIFIFKSQADTFSPNNCEENSVLFLPFQSVSPVEPALPAPVESMEPDDFDDSADDEDLLSCHYEMISDDDSDSDEDEEPLPKRQRSVTPALPAAPPPSPATPSPPTPDQPQPEPAVVSYNLPRPHSAHELGRYHQQRPATGTGSGRPRVEAPRFHTLTEVSQRKSWLMYTAEMLIYLYSWSLRRCGINKCLI